MLKRVSLEDKIRLKEKVIVGLNSGTSADGIDAAVIRVAGSGYKSKVKFIAGKTYKFNSKLKSRIKKYAEPDFKDAEKWLELDIELGDHFARAAMRIIRLAGMRVDAIDLIGSHGQTIRHKPKTKWGAITCQLADPSRIAVKTGIITVGDFRISDTSAGGEGAPLTPIANAILFRNEKKNIGILNIGGIANITHIKTKRGNCRIFGCDAGPGNMLIDYSAKKLFNREYDSYGHLAAKGTADYSIINKILSRKFFSIKGPKSTGREAFGNVFGERFLYRCRNKGLNKYDIMATASMITIEAVRRCCKINRLSFDELILSGGGVGNNYIKDALSKIFPLTKITTSVDYGIPPGYLEAVSFAILANEALCSNGCYLKNVTGAKRAVILGKICQS